MTYLGAWRAMSGDERRATELDGEIMCVLEDAPERAFTVPDLVRELDERQVTVEGAVALAPAVRLMLSELELDGQVRGRAVSWRRPRTSRVWHYVSAPERVSRAAGQRARTRVLAGVAAGAVAVTLALLLSGGGEPQAARASGSSESTGVVTSSAAVDVPTTSVQVPTTSARAESADGAPRKCEEDEWCFNSCVWGTGGLSYPAWDSRAGLPGPCDTTSATVLPRGRRLDVLVVPMPSSGVECLPATPGWHYAEVSVFLREIGGLEVSGSRVTVHGCVPGDPALVDQGLNGVFPEVVRAVAARA